MKQITSKDKREAFCISLLNRVKGISESIGISLTSLSEGSGHARNYFSQIYSRKTLPEIDFLKYVSEVSGVSLDNMVMNKNEIASDQELIDLFLRVSKIDEFHKRVIKISIKAVCDEYDRMKNANEISG